MKEGEKYPYEFARQNFRTYEILEVSDYVVIGRAAAELHCDALQRVLSVVPETTKTGMSVGSCSGHRGELQV